MVKADDSGPRVSGFDSRENQKTSFRKLFDGFLDIRLKWPYTVLRGMVPEVSTGEGHI